MAATVPYGTSISRLERLCRLLSAGSMTKSNLYDDETDWSRGAAYHTMTLGKALGLLEDGEDNSKIRLTPRGEEFLDEDKKTEVLRDAVHDFGFYEEALSQLLDKISPHRQSIKRREVADILNTMLEDSHSENTVNRAATLFLRTLDRAGYGTYGKSSGSREHQFSFREEELSQLQEELGEAQQYRKQTRLSEKESSREEMSAETSERDYTLDLHRGETFNVDIQLENLTHQDYMELVSHLEKWKERE